MIPHLVNITEHVEPEKRIQPLYIIGSVAASLLCNPNDAPNVPEELEKSFHSAMKMAYTLTIDTLQSNLEHQATSILLATLAALKGEGNIAMNIFMGDGQALFCPECGEEIDYRN